MKNIKEDKGWFNRIISWIVLYIGGGLVGGLGLCLIQLVFFFLEWLNDKSVALYLFLLLTVGSLFLMVLLLPFFYGSNILVKASEAVCPSRKGLRYDVMALVNTLLTLLNILLTSGENIFPKIYSIIFYIAVAIRYRSSFKE